MTPHAKWAIAGVAVGLFLLIFNLWWVALAVIGVAIAIPTIAWFMLDESQRRRIKQMRRRQLNR